MSMDELSEQEEAEGAAPADSTIAPELLEYEPSIPRARLRQSEAGVAALIFGVFLFCWMMLPALGIRADRVDVFHNLQLAGPLMAIEALVFSYIGVRQQGRSHVVAWWAVGLNVVNFFVSIVTRISV